jgi:monomeric sarcosine oxidase
VRVDWKRAGAAGQGGVVAERIDLVVIGGGLMGAAAAYAAARRGLGVTLFEQFPIGHRRGSSHGSARIVRRGYSDALYTRLSGEAFELWREVEHAAGMPLLRMVGGLDHGPQRTERVARLLAEAGVEYELVDAAEAEARWVGMRFVGPVVYHPQAGTMDADRTVAALLDLATRAGATVRPELRVREIDARDGEVFVVVDGGERVAAHAVVVAAGAWVEPLVRGRLTLPPLTVTQQQVFHFSRWDATAAPWPSVIHQDAVDIYHLPGGRDGGSADARKVAEHGYGTPTTADARDGRVDPASRERVIRYVAEWLPGLDPSPHDEATCLYTTTPSEDFLIDRVGPIVVCSPCSGHGAKFAPLVGELVAGLVTGEREVPDRFRLAAHKRSPAVAKVSL